MLLSNTSEFPIGLDISDFSLKLVQLNKAGESFSIQAISKIDLPAGIIDDGEIKNRDELVKYLKNLIDTPRFGKVSSHEVTACLPENKTFVKLIEIDNGPNDLRETILAEMEKHIPLPVDEIYFDWQIVSKDQGKNLVLLGAAPKQIVDDYSNIFDELGLSVFALEIESSAICRALLPEENSRIKSDQTNNYAILDIGAKRTSMIFYAHKTILFTVSLPISGEAVTKNIADNLKIDRDQAERAKIICGLDEEKAEGVIREILASQIGELVKKIKEVLSYYETHFPGQGAIGSVFLCGGGSNIENIDKILADSLGLPVLLGDPLLNIKDDREKINHLFAETYSLSLDAGKNNSGDDLTYTQNSSLAFATAIGLGLRGLFIDEL
ncbi:type IV pilus assembly protein PilM [Candidatus Falkowbacteria bacterium]|nr:type IV pilus assembly protein PilM [Candidatus Falkowbacteria bacterium]